MAKHKYEFTFEVVAHSNLLSPEDNRLLAEARTFTENAYAPYSRFHVAAVARMENGDWIRATNQENASYPVGICAERVLLSILSTTHPGMAIDTIAISYHNHGEGKKHGPISPCGLCRQSLLEYEGRIGKNIRFILSGLEGEALIVFSAKDLLPFAFDSDNLLS